jgi:transcriptional regulator with XRE-family HTH domain
MVKTLLNARRARGLRQRELAELTELTQGQISNLERYVCNPTRDSKRRIEKVLGHIDWIGNSNVMLRNATWVDSEITLKRLVEQTLLMDLKQRKEFSRLVRKYFK